VPYYQLSGYPANTTFTIHPQTVGTGGSVEYKLSKYQKVDLTYITYPQVQLEDPVSIFRSVVSKSPYPLGGYSIQGNHYNAVPALRHSGAYLLEAFAYAGPNKQFYRMQFTPYGKPNRQVDA